MNKRLIHSIAAFMIAALLVSVTGVALNRHSCFVTGYTGVSVVASAHPEEDPDCPHHNHSHEANGSAAQHSCCENKACDTGAKISQPEDCCSNTTQVVAIDSTSVIAKHDVKFVAPAFILTFFDDIGLRDKVDKLKLYIRSVKEAARPPIVGLIKILRIINPSRQDSPEAA